jgi:hypothetical protein
MVIVDYCSLCGEGNLSDDNLGGRLASGVFVLRARDVES